MSFDSTRQCTLVRIDQDASSTNQWLHMDFFAPASTITIRVNIIQSRLLCTMPTRRVATTKAKTAAPAKPKPKSATLTIFKKPEEVTAVAIPPARSHISSYHYPLLVDDRSQQDALLEWFKGVEDSRTMPWRKAWLDRSQDSEPSEDTARILNKRAYEVWVSEVSK